MGYGYGPQWGMMGDWGYGYGYGPIHMIIWVVIASSSSRSASG